MRRCTSPCKKACQNIFHERFLKDLKTTFTLAFLLACVLGLDWFQTIGNDHKFTALFDS